MAIVDQFGRPIPRTALRKEQGAPTVSGVRRPSYDAIADGLTPLRLATLLRESVEGDPESYFILAEAMEERDLHYAGVLGIRKRQVAGLEITVEAVSDSAEDVRDADLVREVIERPSFQDELIDILDAIGKGISATEIVWDTSEGQWRPSALKWRDPRFFDFADDRETLLLRDDAGLVPLRPFTWIVHQGKAKSGLPIRGGLARAVAWGYLFKSFTVKDWAIFAEAYGQPLRLGKYGPDATEDDIAKLVQAVTSIGADFAAVVPASMSVDFIKAEISGSHELYEKRADWLDRQTSKVVLGQTATTDAQAGGYAVGKVHDGVREDIEVADARQLGATLMRDLVQPVVVLNHGPRKAYPKLRIGRPDQVDTDKLVANVVKLVPLGLRVGMSTMRDKLGIPDPAPDEEVLTPARVAPVIEPPAPGGIRPPAPGNVAPQSSGGGLDRKDAVDLSVAAVVADGWEMMIEPIVRGLEAELDGAASIEEVTRILAERLRGMSPDILAEQLARARFAARLAGEVDDPLHPSAVA